MKQELLHGDETAGCKRKSITSRATAKRQRDSTEFQTNTVNLLSEDLYEVVKAFVLAPKFVFLPIFLILILLAVL
jgi:hypothetical protein